MVDDKFCSCKHFLRIVLLLSGSRVDLFIYVVLLERDVTRSMLCLELSLELGSNGKGESEFWWEK